MKTWAMSGMNVPTIKVQADSFDDAIKQARQVDQRYDGGQVVSYEQGGHVYRHGELLAKHADGSCDFMIFD